MIVRLSLVLLALASGCSVVSLAGHQLGHYYEREGLSAAVAELGPDTVHYWHGGAEGRPVLLIQGFGASAKWQWALQVEAFAESRRVIMPDLLWFGESTSADSDYSLAHQVRALVALLDALGEERVDVVGISYGGLVAYELASAFPERVRRLVVVDSPGRAYTHRDYRALCDRFGVEHFADVLLPADNDGMRRLLEAGMKQEVWAPPFVLRQAREDLFLENAPQKRAMVDALLRDLEELRHRPDPRARDTLLVWGRGDPIFPLELGHRLARRLGPGVRLEVLDHARHTPNFEWPDSFDALVLQFLDMPCSCETRASTPESPRSAAPSTAMGRP